MRHAALQWRAFRDYTHYYLNSLIIYDFEINEFICPAIFTAATDVSLSPRFDADRFGHWSTSLMPFRSLISHYRAHEPRFSINTTYYTQASLLTPDVTNASGYSIATEYLY
jgi:hypothetical protein